MADTADVNVSQALNSLRRAGQMMQWLEGLEEAARSILRKEENMSGLTQAILEKQQVLGQLERTFVELQETVMLTQATMDRDFGLSQREHAAQLDRLDQELAKKERDVATACANEDALYLQQVVDHSARTALLRAEIDEREGYLARLNQRIGALRADLDSVREV